MMPLEIYTRAKEIWGVPAQVDKLVEECGELIQALMKYRLAPTEKRKRHLIEELADVMIMTDQIIAIMPEIGHQAVMQQMHVKLARMAERLEAAS